MKDKDLDAIHEAIRIYGSVAEVRSAFRSWSATNGTKLSGKAVDY